MFYTVNHSTHGFHTVKHGSSLEKKLNEKSIGERLNITVGHDTHSVFETAAEAKYFHTLLTLGVGQA